MSISEHERPDSPGPSVGNGPSLVPQSDHHLAMKASSPAVGPEIQHNPSLRASLHPPRLALESDIPALSALIPLSVRGLQSAHYSPAQMDAALGPVFGVDRQLIRDGTYFVVESDGAIVGCGGWSRRRSLFGGDGGRANEDDVLDPKRDAARVRAFFVHPAWARRGIGRSIMVASEQAIVKAGFQTVDIVATLAGVPLYAAFQYQVVERFEIPLSGGLQLPAVRMTKSLRPTQGSPV